MKKKNILFLVVCVLVAGTYHGYRYLYKDHRNIQAETVAVEVDGKELLALFLGQSGKEVLNKTVLVTGSISEFDSLSITLDNVVHCVLLESEEHLVLGENVSIKGRCIGYDELFEIVKLDQCQLINIP